MQVPKACCLKICEGLKFGLVHKFPSDVDKYNEWIQIIETKAGGVIDKMKNLTQDQVKKRFFICCRHFGMSSYKNAESRSLNITANPHLNLLNLDDYNLSKAYQLENSSVPQQRSPAKLEAPIKILNTEASSSPAPPRRVVTIRKEIVNVKRKDEGLVEIRVTPQKRPHNSQEEFILKSPKNIKLQEITEDFSEVLVPSQAGAQLEIIEQNSPIKSSPIKSSLIEQKGEIEPPSNPPQNKLLALFEVTPEQYQSLSASLTASERNNKVESIVTSFIDKEDNLTETSDENEIEILVSDDKSLKLDLLWLRDHCRCSKCYDHSTYQKKISILDIPDDISTKSFYVNGDKLEVVWCDDHQSTYSLEFLIKNQFDAQKDFQEKILWNKEIIEEPLKSSCRCIMRDYMSDPEVSKGVLESLHRYGVAFIDNVQPTQQNTEFVIRQLFPIHRTLFGDMWTFSDEKKDHCDTAYTNYYLGPHNDNTYFNDASGLQILHCILQQCKGGENFLIDGFQVAEKLRNEQPEVFKRLTTTLIPAEYLEEGHHHKFLAPIIRLDPTGKEIEQIRFNLYDRAPLNSLPSNKIRQFYSDLKVLTRELENSENRISFKLEPGTVMIFDNWRVLHGRNSYEGKRTMTGCYVQRTEFQSALRKNGFIE